MNGASARRYRTTLSRALLLGAVVITPSRAQTYVNAELPWHPLVLDKDHNLAPWFGTEHGESYDRVLRLGWRFLEDEVSTDPRTGTKVYLAYSTFDPKTGQGRYWQHNPASTYAEFVDSLVAWYPYSGDRRAVAVVRSMLDYQLAYGTTPQGWEWPNVPFATACAGDHDYGKCLQGLPRSSFGGIETDKVGELGTGYVLFYELSGDVKYLKAAIACADALASHVRAGDSTHSPWPFRVNARSGDVIDGSEYGGMVVAPVRLFSELIRLGKGPTLTYEQARRAAWNWILEYPMKNDAWVGYFEDMPYTGFTDDINQASPTMTAYYILSQPDPAAVDPSWKADVGHLIDWVRSKLGTGPFFGAWGINEQGKPPNYDTCCSRAGVGSDTSRWAAVNAMYYERTGDGQARRDAELSFNYATYFMDADGKVSCCGSSFTEPYWWTDGYADYLRNFSWGMAAIPELAPVAGDHLVRASSVVQNIVYRNRSVAYRTFDKQGNEVLRLHFKPKVVRAGSVVLTLGDTGQEGYSVTLIGDGDYIVRVRHNAAREVHIAG